MAFRRARPTRLVRRTERPARARLQSWRALSVIAQFAQCFPPPASPGAGFTLALPEPTHHSGGQYSRRGRHSYAPPACAIALMHPPPQRRNQLASCRRATSLTLASGARLSSTIRRYSTLLPPLTLLRTEESHNRRHGSSPARKAISRSDAIPRPPPEAYGRFRASLLESGPRGRSQLASGAIEWLS